MTNFKNAPRAILWTALALLALAVPAAATTISIVNLDAPGEGFNDPTAAAPVGGNTGLTVGDQRLIAFNFAATVWENILNSSIEIRIGAQFDPLSCMATSGTLGSAGPWWLWRDYANAPEPGTWFVEAEADMHDGFDHTPGDRDINATFNSDIGQPGCLETSAWYYGLDGNAPPGEFDLVVVLLHEFAHGLGFLSMVNKTTGELFLGFMDIYSSYLFDNTTGLHWDEMTDAQRAASAIDTGNLVWNGPTVTESADEFLCLELETEITSPVSIAGVLDAPPAGFNPDCEPTAVGEVVLVDDATGTTSDGCEAILTDLTGKIALIDRGTCAFTQKVINAQNAGAIGVIVANNIVDPPFNMGGADPAVLIPSVMISQADGNAIKAELGTGVFVAIAPHPTQLAGTDGLGRLKIYNPNPVEGGSSISHWDTDASPNLLMEPFISADLGIGVDLTLHLFNDIYWQFFAVANEGLPYLAAERLGGEVVVSWDARSDLLDHRIYVHREQVGAPRVQISNGYLPYGATSFRDSSAPDGPADYWLQLESPAGTMFWQGPISVKSAPAGALFSFAPAVPNPFRTESALSFALPRDGQVRVAVHDLRGRLVRELVNSHLSAGPHQMFWDGRTSNGGRAAAGVYYARLDYDGNTRTQKMVLMK